MADGRERDEAEGVADGGDMSSDDWMRDWEETLRALRESEQATASDEADATQTEHFLSLHTEGESERILRESERMVRESERMARETAQMIRETEWLIAGLCEKCGKKPWRESTRCQRHTSVEQARIYRQEAARQEHIYRQEAAKRARIEWQEQSWRVRPKVYSRDGGRCRYCGMELDKDGEWHVDHIEPLYRGGGSEMENLALACVDCNLSKMARPPANFLAEMERGSLAAFLDEPRQRAARDTRAIMITFGCALAVGSIMFTIVATAGNGDGRFVAGFFAALVAFATAFILVAAFAPWPRCTTCSAPPVEGASLCGAHLAAQRRARSGPKRRPRRPDRWG